jgi:acyl transferase domain-containing protein
LSKSGSRIETAVDGIRALASQSPHKLDKITRTVWCDGLLCGFSESAEEYRESSMAKTAFIFPGQGSQSVGMGKALAETYPAARAVFHEVDAALSQKLSHLMFEGPLDELTLTANAQPALMAVSMAAMRVLEKEAGVDLKTAAACVAGHSLGEYSALAAAGSIGIGDAARLLRIRGNAMQAAVPAGVGAMAALLEGGRPGGCLSGRQ